MTAFSKFEWNRNPVRLALKGAAGSVATAMFNRANMDGTRVYVTQQSLADELATSVRTVRRAQKELRALGLIHCVSKGSNKGRAAGPSIYDLTMPPTNTGHPQEHRTPMSSVNCGTPDIGDQNTGHSWPEHRTPVSPLLDPSPDPGTKPGSSKEQANTYVSAVEASISDDRPEIPSGLLGEQDNPSDTDPGWVGSLVEADIADVRPQASTVGDRPCVDSNNDDHPWWSVKANTSVSANPATESVPAMPDRSDPWENDAAFEAAVDVHFASQAEQGPQLAEPEVVVCECAWPEKSCIQASPGIAVRHQLAVVTPVVASQPQMETTSWRGNAETGPIWDS